MVSEARTQVDHVAIRVRDIEWYRRFFLEVMEMPVSAVDGEENDPRQLWLTGGIQLIADPNFVGDGGRLAHLGIATPMLEEVQMRAARRGVAVLERGPNWLQLPDGLCLELLAINPPDAKETGESQ